MRIHETSDEPKRFSSLPLAIAILILLLPLLYIGSYLAVVFPGGVPADLHITRPDGTQEIEPILFTTIHYPWFNKQCKSFYWPLEKIDRKLRPNAWKLPKLKGI